MDQPEKRRTGNTGPKIKGKKLISTIVIVSFRIAFTARVCYQDSVIAKAQVFIL